jgi:excisionase family DNA binding protein
MSTNPGERQLMHVKEAARELDVEPSTVRRAIHSGELRALRLGENGRYRIRRRDLEAFLVEAEPKP